MQRDKHAQNCRKGTKYVQKGKSMHHVIKHVENTCNMRKCQKNMRRIWMEGKVWAKYAQMCKYVQKGKIFSRYVQNMHKICTKYVQRAKYAQNMQNT